MIATVLRNTYSSLDSGPRSPSSRHSADWSSDRRRCVKLHTLVRQVSPFSASVGLSMARTASVWGYR